MLSLLSAPHAAAQGVQTGSVRGVVRDATGMVVAQATIHAESPALLGSRVDRRRMPPARINSRDSRPGEYTLHFEFAGLPDRDEHGAGPVGAIARLDVALPMANRSPKP